MYWFWILCAVALVISAIGFHKFIWFISLGYGYSIAALSIAIVIIFHSSLTPVTVIMACLFLIYGLRLGLFLMIREIKSAAYNQTMKNEVKDGSTMNFFLKVVIWLACGLLYACEVSPLYFRLENGAADSVISIVGICIMAAGIILESLSDFTKNQFKKTQPRRFCDVGVFRMVRCPNYFGEVLTWTGVFVSGITIYSGVWQWIAAIGGYVCIVYIMFSGARRLELRQNKNYGKDPEYQAYVKKTPILIPLIPLKSVAKAKWLVG